MGNLPTRKKIRIGNYDYSTVGAYFVTICTANKEKIFWCERRGGYYPPEKLPLSEFGKIVEKGILQISEHYENVVIDKYCIMPDHIHMIVCITSDKNGRMVSAPTLSTVVGSMKRWVTKQIGRSVWQRSFYDHGIRNQRDYEEIWQYIENNPLKYIIRKAP